MGDASRMIMDMEASVFWDFIERARAGKGLGEGERASASPEVLKAVLNTLSNEEIAEFLRFFCTELIRLNRWEIWGAGYVIAGGMSGDSFHYFRSWLIGKGPAAVEQALTDPDGLGPFVDTEEVENELLEYVALEILEGRGVEEDPREDVEGSPDDEPTGTAFDEDTLEEVYPRLAEQFGG